MHVKEERKSQRRKRRTTFRQREANLEGRIFVVSVTGEI
jgi:hypothetical protein